MSLSLFILRERGREGERDREREQAGEGQRERGTEDPRSGFYADSREPSMGLELRNCEIVT